MKAARVALQMALGIVLPLLVQRWDKARLSPERLGRTWSYATWGAALYAFGPLSMLGWVYVTRRDLWFSLVRRVAPVDDDSPWRSRLLPVLVSLPAGLLAAALLVAAQYAADLAWAELLGD